MRHRDRQTGRSIAPEEITTAGDGLLRCRSCSTATGPLTTIWRHDSTGSFRPASAVCHGCAPPLPVSSADPEKQDIPPVKRAYRPGICCRCGYDILVNETIIRTDAGHAHTECAG